ncbi:hypothetical protein CLV51_104327 [Chitinophaga niastensis]|uniref:Uncharacterized protein n=1 Tax=Chitinophaga niastensis TaxID=536980 RepID=A0A2P8HHF0_CHINA|nr:hypothetical protein [Chitinophaga niastensis]PSL45621.1 hypothetical protein CLV51_104327 [Chitinophaga niastensis]
MTYNSSVILADSAAALASQLNAFFEANKNIDVVSATQSHSDRDGKLQIVHTVIYKEGSQKKAVSGFAAAK